MKAEIINIRVSEELKKNAKKKADSEGRTLSNWIVNLMQKEINKK